MRYILKKTFLSFKTSEEMSLRANFSKALKDFITLKNYFGFNSLGRVKRKHPAINLIVLVFRSNSVSEVQSELSQKSPSTLFVSAPR